MQRIPAENREKGSAILMATLSLFVMCGMLGLAVDLGWSYYRQRAAQTAVDAAALAAVKKVYSMNQTAYSCANVGCQASPTPCSSIASGNLRTGCQYAAQPGGIGFTDGANNQTVKMTADVTSPYVTATGNVTVKYWVRATAAESIPQLFSAILGHTRGVASTFGVAGIVDAVVDGSLILLNRQNDRAHWGNADYYGQNLNVQANDNGGNYALQTTGNIRLASTCTGTSGGPGNCLAGNQATQAGVNQGGGTVYTLPAGTLIRNSGSAWQCPNTPCGYSLQGSSSWQSTPVSASGGGFDDPMSGKGQPPPPQNLTPIPVPGGTLDSTFCSSGICLPGSYYAANYDFNTAKWIPTGNPLKVSGSIRFAACSGCPAGSGFGNYVFFGGLQGANGNGAKFAQFDPGRYVFAGTRTGTLLDTSTNFNISDATASTGQNSDAGEMFIFTNASYTGGPTASVGLQLPPDFANAPGIASQLVYGSVNLQSGNNGTQIKLHGLNKGNVNVPPELQTFSPALLWQDQGNGFVKYNANGSVDASCASLESPCTRTLPDLGSPELSFQASPNIHLYGVIYQPRGAWTTLTGGGAYAGPLQLISGALNVKGNANIDLTSPVQPLTIQKVALIE